MNKWFERIYGDYYLNVDENRNLKKKASKFQLPASQELIISATNDNISETIKDFYGQSNGLELTWDFDKKRNLMGRMNVIALEYVLESWEEKLYFDGANERLKHFRPLDIFTEEACVGILVDGSENETLYYHEFGDSTIYSLDIDFKSYFDLAIDARVFLYWQEYLVELVHGSQGVEVLFKTGMKEVFPDFELEAFTAKFESLRLSKK